MLDGLVIGTKINRLRSRTALLELAKDYDRIAVRKHERKEKRKNES